MSAPNSYTKTSSNTNASPSWLERQFQLQANKTNVRTEILAGITTFVTMSYVLFVNPSVLGAAGMPQAAVFVATAVTAAIACILMGLLANLPVALAAGMGINAFFTYAVVLGAGYSWQMALAGIFVSACIFFLLAITGLREKIISAIPMAMKKAVAVSIGFFIAFIGLKNGGLVVANPATFVSLGHFGAPATLATILGLILTLILFMRRIPGAIFIGMIITAIGCVATGITPIPASFSFGSLDLSATFGVMFTELPNAISNPAFYGIIFAYLFVEFFDAAGTLIAVTSRLGLINDASRDPRFGRAMIVDAATNLFGPILGTSSQTAYIESLAGVEAGGKTGLTAIVVAFCFLASLLLLPFVSLVGSSATAPALILVGALMVESLREIDLSDRVLSTATFFTIITTLLSFSIAKGLAIGFLIYSILMIVSGRSREISPIMMGLCVLFLAGFIFNLL